MARKREILIRIGRVAITARLLDTPTADRVWRALPIFSSAEVFGQSILFETAVETGRERGARLLVNAGEIAFLPDQDRITLAFGPTPISRKGEIRLASPSNVWAATKDDVTALKSIQPGERVAVTAVA